MPRLHDRKSDLIETVADSDIAVTLSSLAWAGALVLAIGAMAYLLWAHNAEPKSVIAVERTTITSDRHTPPSLTAKIGTLAAPVAPFTGLRRGFVAAEVQLPNGRPVD